MVYEPARETVRCAWRNERFVLGRFFRFVPGRKRHGAADQPS
jgi:hypothetical protein